MAIVLNLIKTEVLERLLPPYKNIDCKSTFSVQRATVDTFQAPVLVYQSTTVCAGSAKPKEAAGFVAACCLGCLFSVGQLRQGGGQWGVDNIFFIKRN